MSTLFDLTDKYKRVLELAEQGVDELVINDTLESIDDEIEVKADGYAAVIKQLEANMGAIDKEKERLDKIKKTHNNAIDRMKDSLKDAMYQIETRKIKTSLNHIYVKKNAPSLVVQKEDYIPKEYYEEETTRKLDKKRLKEYLKTHEDEHIDGVGLQQTESVIFK